ncbi:conserved hypothetical protein [Mycoplasmopsis pulmonis]|uniref:Glycerol-3-phosphate acyltransferase n=1 Tax=Mycoplasmopsis pulmonis (strain UAB CTIP) TaxID=272635 RepID=PLSY_MYCPU|nr:glycerol-3-phosphate 1-O-acyltransferase PlsY [Mycoplasmopsis pulmonis]Q98QR6.1 RecName: Full=Glycerol-3-phosphate acyltransferase; AltName: Full=Acyl-PO4 G3P acyltransferase; AltName: Full=Acyl-phosphate--glycerol-3-phosphate acyltransferase; AltName: Full=G3P acyltransferase; Short=GPAT; AltName: Full=Lysophosphatidic acid synthase; Short=LPA synthase [Mycoplasmopsis pulmonis UAB CTIP]CAC13468.1 conserved hypothetical protein [Mycoplasmopsis pulmonis]
MPDFVIVLINLAFCLGAYLFGSINFSIIYSKFKKNDVRKLGSGNAGSTNVLRNFGVKIALVIFALDILKTYLASLLVYFVNLYAFKDSVVVFHAVAYCVVIGHIFPIWHKFKGGKGAASTLGYIISVNIIIAVIGAIVYLLIIIYWKRIVSFTTLITIPSLLPLMFIPWMSQLPLGFIAYQWPWWISPLVYVLIILLVIWSHHENISRMIKGQEKVIKWNKTSK